MRYQTITKTARNRAVVDARARYPDLSLKEIGQMFGICKQRVWQILDRAKRVSSPPA